MLFIKIFLRYGETLLEKDFNGKVTTNTTLHIQSSTHTKPEVDRGRRPLIIATCLCGVFFIAGKWSKRTFLCSIKWKFRPQNHSLAFKWNFDLERRILKCTSEIWLKNFRIIGWSLFWFTCYFDGRSSFAHRYVFLYYISGSYSSIRASSHKKTYLWLAPSRGAWCTYFGRSYLDSARAFIENIRIFW